MYSDLFNWRPPSSRTYYRGTSVSSEEEVVKCGLTMENPSSGAYRRSSYFVTGVYLGASQEGAEDWAKMIAKREGKKPCVISVTVNPRNFKRLKGNITEMRLQWRGEIAVVGEDDQKEFVPKNFEDLTGQQITVNFGILTREDLRALHSKVGFYDEARGIFVYKSFAKMENELNNENGHPRQKER